MTDDSPLVTADSATFPSDVDVAVIAHDSRDALPDFVTTLSDQAAERNNELLGARNPPTPAGVS